MDIARWQRRLEENFSEDNLTNIVKTEREYGEYVRGKFRGQTALMDAFQNFFIETLRSVPLWVNQHGWPPSCPTYAPIYGLYFVLFKSIRACENMFLSGYPLDGLALLRDVKDRAIFLTGIARNLTTHPAILGFPQSGPITDVDIIRKAAQDEERRLLELIIRSKSGLPVEVRKELRQWESMFNSEVHGSKFTFTLELGPWLRGKELSIPLGPVPRTASIAMYMNRVVEMGWLLVRLLPFLQPVEGAFGPTWNKKQLILDHSFRRAVEALGDLGKKIAGAFIYFVDEKLTFPESFHYFEADGSAS